MKRLILVLMLALTMSAYTAVLYAGSCSMGGSHSHAKGEAVNSTCPVMGGDVDKDTPYTTEYEGKTIGFCCSGCIKAFEDNPEDYVNKLDLN